ncbi:carboxylesterase [Metapseudomonas resinovorans]|uniref:Serine aminopeptidase S33 domain-containing protein n=1 Tax=Metapseudomonas resinovorans NBRC 106553 TaxID=1245471 RepID=S6ADE0_METRE|nr:alpha/beta hydrolase [Pseudomonas resinovorans]BAN47192.1 hypothetical protein PCA10_14600 [Pseudomonas resinovorans NBRC 106553]
MRKFAVTTGHLLLLIVAVALLTFWGVRAYTAWRSPPPQLWHTFVPKELTVEEMDRSNWTQYLDREAQLFADVRSQVSDKLPDEAKTPSNRYYPGARVYPPSLANDWNRSYVMEPRGPVRGAVVLLHGLTDTPFSLRHVAQLYAEQGFVAIGLRIPAHGTVPAALTSVTWEDWMAGTRLAVREAKRRIQPDMPLHLVGFSNGGALALKYAMDSLEDPALARADRLILLSPMIGITRFARFAGLASVPAFFPPFAKSAWLGIVPEFNPFKYNSFPVNGARQTHRLTTTLQQQVTRLARLEVFNELPPILTFQSVMDYTVSTSAILYALYEHLPQNGSELVLYDVNRASVFGPLMRSASEVALSRILPPLPHKYGITVVGNAAPNSTDTVARTTVAGGREEQVEDLHIEYPKDIFSLSHVAVPFPMDDPLYGMRPAPGSDAEYGVNLGTLAARGERGALIVQLDSLFRTTSNPFFPYQMQRIDGAIRDPKPQHAGLAPRSTVPEPTPPATYEADIEKFLNESTEDYDSQPF